MQTAHFTREAVEKATEKMLAERGENFVYESPKKDNQNAMCQYAHATENGFVPGCAVGYIVNEVHGFVPNEWDGAGSIDTLAGDGLATFDSAWTKRFLTRLQFCQDQGWTYGDSVRDAVDSANFHVQP